MAYHDPSHLSRRSPPRTETRAENDNRPPPLNRLPPACPEHPPHVRCRMCTLAPPIGNALAANASDDMRTMDGDDDESFQSEPEESQESVPQTEEERARQALVQALAFDSEPPAMPSNGITRFMALVPDEGAENTEPPMAFVPEITLPVEKVSSPKPEPPAEPRPTVEQPQARVQPEEDEQPPPRDANEPQPPGECEQPKRPVSTVAQRPETSPPPVRRRSIHPNILAPFFRPFADSEKQAVLDRTVSHNLCYSRCLTDETFLTAFEIVAEMEDELWVLEEMYGYERQPLLDRRGEVPGNPMVLSGDQRQYLQLCHDYESWSRRLMWVRRRLINDGMLVDGILAEVAVKRPDGE
jgi:hypothetical protein